MTVVPQQFDPLSCDGQTLSRNLRELGAALHRSSWAPCLSYHGIDVIDVLTSPLHHALLKLLRLSPGGSVATPSKSAFGWGGWISARNAAYRVKQRYLARKFSRRAEPFRQVDYLFWPRNANHLNAQQPVIAELRRRDAPLGIIACQVSSLAELLRRKEPAMFAPAGWPQAHAAARRDGRRLARSLARLPAVPSESLGLPNGERLLANLRRVLINHLPDACIAIVNAEQAVERLSPRVFVVGYDITMEGRAACLVGRRLGISSAVLMQGSFSGASILKTHVADRVIVYGNAQRLDLLSSGVPDDRIAVCGAPYLDSRPQQTGAIDARIAERFRLDPARPYVLVATSGPGHAVSLAHHEQSVDAIAQLSADLPNVQFVVKLHPKDSTTFYDAARAKNPQSRLCVVPSGTSGLPKDIFDWFQGCSLMLTGASATAFEAMVLDVPVVTMDLCSEFRQVSFIDAGATAHVRSFPELTLTVRRLLETTDDTAVLRGRAREFLGEMFFALDGRSSERAADVIAALAQTSVRSPS